MDDLVEEIATIEEKYPNNRLDRMKATVEMMTNFPGLNRLCRLHCSTKMINGGILIPNNSVGYHGCLPNEPDNGFVEMEE
jgi:fructose-1,6-bisphosphatase